MFVPRPQNAQSVGRGQGLQPTARALPAKMGATNALKTQPCVKRAQTGGQKHQGGHASPAVRSFAQSAEAPHPTCV